MNVRERSTPAAQPATDHKLTRRTALFGATLSGAALAAAVVAKPPAALAETGENPELPRLGAEFERLWAEEIAAKPEDHNGDWSAWDVAYERTSAIVQEIAHQPAITLEGLCIQARAIDWCHGGQFGGFYESYATDQNLTGQIVAALVSMAGKAVL